MKRNKVPKQTRVFRALTIFSSGMGAAMLALWALDMAGMTLSSYREAATFGAIVLGLASLAGAGTAHAYFAGGDDASQTYEALLSVDSVTGLLSRSGLAESIDGYVSKGGGPSRMNRFFLISLDFDSLRDFNETYGLETGDSLLRVFGDRLQRVVGDTGLAARTSGGEFVIVLAANHDDRELRAATEALLGILSLPVRVGNASHSVFWNAGVAEIHKNNPPMERILRHANLARTTSRATGRGTWSIYHPEMSQVAAYRHWIEAELGGALQRDELMLHYQPKVHAVTGETVGYEALLRWNHHQNGSIPPSEFIPIAEQCGLIQQIGDFVLRRVCEDLEQLPDNISVSANVSPAQFNRDDFVANLGRLINGTEIRPDRLEIEVTETLLIRNHSEVRRLLAQLRELGILLAIDDFGTGYSNLSTLNELRFNTLKIDKSFVDRLTDKDPAASTMVASIVGMARSMGASVVAEGVETQEQATLLRAAGCTIMQGYLFGKPQPLSAIKHHHRDSEAGPAGALPAVPQPEFLAAAS
ncbi:MAG: bifunctional diguanylate cyclase/phosphodiesterase [Roseitalea sp.]|nr:bifunctional diguanylate cyclase/phosphodiesterase [Roseitalea sp.]MBO6952475.1 bifunctional diguanylate cyclase/phosphodiesterase [Rhizobiaceae bacterium]MBO6593039.1 bifunctional diguanylate cyclase/phosphodiesterase [Roseitalea sp.]MBO6600219.1 bifunctional diguanylate cyclase/phosphodiesterase [Roseitalea sp.]MBO6613816.1 bifunctional diguanylate cyclase/phosphodiesterase [Roseitalea sp.]